MSAQTWFLVLCKQYLIEFKYKNATLLLTELVTMKLTVNVLIWSSTSLKSKQAIIAHALTFSLRHLVVTIFVFISFQNHLIDGGKS